MAKMYFRYGAMKGGKSAHLLQVAYNYDQNNMKVLVLKSSRDSKGGEYIESRIGINRKVDFLLQPNETIKEKTDLKDVKCVIIDEAQFLTKEQIKELLVISKLEDIPVICYGIKTNFKGELFEGSATLLALSDDIEELATICSCGKKAKFNARMENGIYITNGEEIAIDDKNAKYEYDPLCGKCFLQKVLKIKKY